MENAVFTKIYSAPSYNRKEILRYAGVMGCEFPSDMVTMMEECLDECVAKHAFSYKVSYRFLPVSIIRRENHTPEIDFGLCRVASNDLAKNLEGCEKCIFFAATVGYGIDEMIVKYSRLDAAKTLFMQAIGAERVESLCDTFCADKDIFVTENENEAECRGGSAYRLRPRFSPGYGDLALDMQKDFLNITEARKRLNIILNDSLLMSPSKSVTAIVGMEQSHEDCRQEAFGGNKST